MEEKYIEILIKNAKKAAKKGEVPVSALIVKDNKVISVAYNKKHNSNFPFDHAEILAIKKACQKIKNWRLDGCTLYVTLKPCKMCYSVIAEARITKIKYLLDSDYQKAEESNHNKIEFEKLEENETYKTMLNDFFKRLR